MPKAITLGFKSNLSGDKVVSKGTFSQRAKVWDAMVELSAEPIESLFIVDDVSGAKAEATTARLNKLLSKSGRVHIVDSDGSVLFLLVEGEMNVIRGPDFDEDSNLIYNPAVKK